MNKKEIAEIKKQFTPQNCALTRLCACYVDGEKNKKSEMKEAFLSQSEEECFKYFEIFRKSLSGTVGKNLVNLEFPLDGEMSAKLAGKGQQSADVILGVRPEHIAVQKDPSASAIEASIEVSELMGSELHLHLAANGQDVVAVIPTANIDPMAYARHTAVKFGFDAKLVHLFDSDSEKNLI